MKKITVAGLYFFFTLIVMLFTGCRKLVDRIFYERLEDRHCKIVQFKQNLGFGDDAVRTGPVYYNDREDPDSVMFDIETGSAGAAYFVFTYDKNGQLIEYRADYSRQADDYLTKHHYKYKNGLVVTDTTWARQSGSGIIVYTLHYDRRGRIIKEDGHMIELDGQPADIELDPIIYTYDDAGNLNSNRIEYDEEVSFLRTNEVWMFTQRNYSRNNPVGATSYNQFDLPLGFPNDGGISFLGFTGPQEIVYDCAK